MKTPSNKGFATVLALLIVALLVVVLVGAAMMVRIETFTSSNSQKIMTARQNALYGMEMALADLQTLAGPDQRVTATAELNRDGTDSRWIPQFLTNGTATNAPATPARNWVGVWDVSRTRSIPDSTLPGRVLSNVGTNAGQLSPAPMKWLVSGGKTEGGAAETQTNNITPLAYPARILNDGSIAGVSNTSDHVVLLGNGTVDLADTPEAGVVVPKQFLFNPIGPVPNNPVGAYAYWVGDEGVKARFQDGAESTAFGTSFTANQRDSLRLLAPQKLGIGSVTSNGSSTFRDEGFNPSEPAFADSLRRLASDSQIGYMPDGNNLGPAFRRRFHDLSLHSRGVLSDAKKGGLKQDLSVYLEQGNIPGLIADSDLLYEDSRDDPSIAAASNPRAVFRKRFPGFHPTSNFGLPMFGYLRSWYDTDPLSPTVRARDVSTTTTTPSNPNHGLYPVVTRCEWPAWLHFNVPNPAPAYPHSIASNDGQVRLRFHPVITLYNPYNADLPGVDYILRIRVEGNGTFEILENAPLSNVTGNMTFSVGAYIASANTQTNDSAIYLRIPASESAIPAGQSKIFTLDASGPCQQVMDMVSDYVSYSQNFGQTTNIRNPSASVLNQNGYFEVPANPGSTLQITANPSGVSTIFRMRFWGNISAPADPNSFMDLPRGLTLHRASSPTSLGAPLQVSSNWPIGIGWLANANGAFVTLSFTSGQFPGTVQADSRLPVGQFHARPLVHRSTNGVGPEGGMLAQLLTGDSRAPSLHLTPSRFGAGLPGSSSLNAIKWFGPFVMFSDSTTGINNTCYSPPEPRFSGNGFYDAVNYYYNDQTPSVRPGGLVSGSFSWNALGNAMPLFGLRPEAGLLGIGWLQHADVAGHANQPAYIIGNSWVYSPLRGRNHYAGFYNYESAGSSFQFFALYPNPKPANPSEDRFNLIYDASFMANDALWDRFFVSDIDPGSPVSAELLTNDESLPNARLRFRKSLGADYLSLSDATGKFERGAAFLMMDGAFNVNSVSVEAWKAVLGARLGLRMNNSTANSDQAVFVRAQNPWKGNGDFFDPPASQPGGELAGAYTGARRLSADEVDMLAREIVAEVRQRGPFTSVSDFVNRRLTEELTGPPFAETASSATGLSGALQSAIDRVSLQNIAGVPAMNGAFLDASIPGSFFSPAQMRTFNSDPRGDVDVSDATLQGAYVPRLAMLGQTRYPTAAGVPGFLTQADILQAIGPLLAARSDTFRIRSYGEVKNPRNGKIEARAWCEAIVQRVPDPFKTGAVADDLEWPERPAAASDPANAAGRKFRVIGFRWLSPSEV